MISDATGAAESALRVLDKTWEELRRGPYVQQQLGVVSRALPEVSLAEAQRRSAVGLSLLKQLDELNRSALPHDLALSLRLASFRASTWVREADWYWFVVDPLGIGLFGMFLPSAYCGGTLLDIVHGTLTAYPLTDAGAVARYASLLEDYARLLDQFTERTAGQSLRGIHMPKVQVHQARSLLSAFRSRARQTLMVTPNRLSSIPNADAVHVIESCITESIEPAFDRALEGLSDEYLAAAPDTVGLSQYPGGAEIYADLVKLHTTLKLTPEQVHARGHQRMGEIKKSMESIRSELGFAGDAGGFQTYLDRDARWRATTPEAVTAVFQRYIDRFKPHFNEYFSCTPKASFSVAPLPAALQESMTYGYYDAPKQGRPEGRYLFNSANLTHRALFHLGPLTYHETVPGHHLHLATQQENDALHPVQKYSLVTAYNEGWAEYGATLAGEIGLYEQPEERYGRLVMDAFLSCRLVVDTGMNALGWSLERAREYMREHSGMTETEIQKETVRYSCDIPAQSLAYKLGDLEILDLRGRMQSELGKWFNFKAFHSVILASGALPLSDLRWHVEHEIVRLKSETGTQEASGELIAK